MPLEPSARIGCARPSQKLKSPTTETDLADRAHVRAELLPQLLVAALADEVQVELADRGQEPVRVLGGLLAVAVVDVEAVGERQLRLRDVALEDAGGVHLLQRHGLPPAGH